MERCWEQRLGADTVVTLSQRQGTGQGGGPTVYDVEMPSTVGTDLQIHPSADATVLSGPTRERMASDLTLTVAVETDADVERVVVSWADGRTVLYVPSRTLIQRCRAAVGGDESAAKAVLAAFRTPVQVPLICGSFLDVHESVALVDAITTVDGYASSLVHAFRYPIVRAALACPVGLTVTSAAELEALVTGFDALETIGPVQLTDSLVETMATVHGSVTELTELLTSLGYDPAAVERRDDGRFLTYTLAHRVMTSDVRSARHHARRRQRQLEGDYDQQKAEARNATSRHRGRKWRRLLCAAARESHDEFVYVLANALYWTGYEVKSDSRTSELLYEAASAAVAELNLPGLGVRAQFARHIAAGHRHRRCHQFSAAAERFREAKTLAQGYEFLPTWEARYNEVVVHAHGLSVAGEHQSAFESIEDGIGDLLQFDIPPEEVSQAMHHLKGQQLEAKAESLRTVDPQRGRAALVEARDHFAVIGFDRSRERTEGKLERLTDATSTPAQDATADRDASSTESAYTLGSESVVDGDRDG